MSHTIPESLVIEDLEQKFDAAAAKVWEFSRAAHAVVDYFETIECIGAEHPFALQKYAVAKRLTEKALNKGQKKSAPSSIAAA